MPCPYLEGENLKVCAVLEGTMVLSVGELNDYCATEESFKGCQFFKEAELNEGEIESRDA
ncbi:hypothetical protein L6386_01590 [bacterium]|nr:hypothetical protein [bacterium]